ncbi:MAG: hypothetical protein ABJA70_18755 [Chryseolinea sp.]
MIDQVISGRRAVSLLKMYTFENFRVHALLYLAVTSFLVLWLGVHLSFTNSGLFSERTQVLYYFVTLFLAGCLSSGVLFSELSDRPKAVNYLLTPASSLEKFLCSLFFGVVLFIVASSLVFSTINSIAVAIANYKFDTHWEAINVLTLNKYPNVFFDGPLTNMFFLYFPIQAIFILCSVHFSTHALFKAIVCIGLLWVCFIFVWMFSLRLLPNGHFDNNLESYELVDPSGDLKLIKMPRLLARTILVFFEFLLTPLLWCVAYLKLKEKEL